MTAMAAKKSGDALVDCAAMWEPFGGAPSEEVFVNLGVDMNEYKRRLFTRLTNPDRAGLIDPALRSRLIDYSVHATGITQRPHRQVTCSVGHLHSSAPDRESRLLPSVECRSPCRRERGPCGLASLNAEIAQDTKEGHVQRGANMAIALASRHLDAAETA